MTTDDVAERIEFAWNSCAKWATSASSDVVAIVERSDGSGVLLMIDVQGSGASGSRLAHTLMGFARELAASGTAPSVVALATSQHLFSLREGRVSASIHLVSMSSAAAELHISGYGNCLVASSTSAAWEVSEFVHPSAGTSFDCGPGSLSTPVPARGMRVIANDGIARSREQLVALLPNADSCAGARELSAQVFSEALRRDHGRPGTDMAVAAFVRQNGSRGNAGSLELQIRNHRGAL